MAVKAKDVTQAFAKQKLTEAFKAVKAFDAKEKPTVQDFNTAYKALADAETYLGIYVENESHRMRSKYRATNKEGT